jgi:hypothetical protein
MRSRTFVKRKPSRSARGVKKGHIAMGGIIYLVGLVVVVMAILSFVGLG